jgi:hypothetical protein
MEDEWRVTAHLPTAAKLEEIVLPEDAEVTTHEGWKTSAIRVYTAHERSAEAAREAIEMFAAGHELSAPPPLVERWNPGAREWQDPALRVEPAEPPEPRADEVDFDSLNYEIRAHLPEPLPARIEARLTREGIAVFPRGRRRLWVGARDLGEAQELVDHLRLELPIGTSVDLRPLTWFRRWRIKEVVLGNYASGGYGG